MAISPFDRLRRARSQIVEKRACSTARAIIAQSANLVTGSGFTTGADGATGDLAWVVAAAAVGGTTRAGSTGAVGAELFTGFTLPGLCRWRK